jgi:acyl-CoA dehydrogenase
MTDERSHATSSEAEGSDPGAELRSLLAESVERIFAAEVGRERIIAAERGEWLGSLWDAVEAAGLLRPHLPEDAGGAGASFREAFVVARAVGRHSVPLPIAETMIAGWLLARAGLEVPAGPLALAPHPLPGTALRGDRLDATIARVPHGRHAGHVVALVPAEGETAVVCAPLSGAVVREGRNLALEPRDDLQVETRPSGVARVSFPPSVVEALGALFRTAQMAGALSTILDLAVLYARERVQFGKPIGGFQAIQQELGRLAGQVAEAGTASEVAFRAASEATSFGGPFGKAGDPTFEIACAKVVVGEAAELGPRIAHQVHGAIGFTYEHSLHFATRRLWAWRSEFGTTEEWAALLGTATLAAGADALWPTVTSR